MKTLLDDGWFWCDEHGGVYEEAYHLRNNKGHSTGFVALLDGKWEAWQLPGFLYAESSSPGSFDTLEEAKAVLYTVVKLK